MENRKSITEIIQNVKDRMCNEYCKWPYIWDKEKEGMELEESRICQNCPLDEL